VTAVDKEARGRYGAVALPVRAVKKRGWGTALGAKTPPAGLEREGDIV
jgi:hypothetical protein